MTIIDQLACSLGRRDEIPNQELARRLAETEDQQGIAEIADNLSNKNAAIQADCIKVLYEIGYLRPDLISAYAADFLNLLKNRNNRLVWGAMIALATISKVVPDALYPHVDALIKAIDSGSVITRDAGIWALSDIAAGNPAYCETIFPYLLNHLRACRPKDVPQHAERIVVAVGTEQLKDFLQVIGKRMEDMSASQQKRLNAVIKRAQSSEN